MLFNFQQRRLAPYFIFAAIGCLYLCFPSRLYLGDDFAYALAIERADFKATCFSNPHHLAFAYLGYVLFKICQLFGYEGRAVFILQSMNSILAISGVLLFFIFIKKILKSALASTLAATTLAFSFAYWCFATGAEAYMGGIVFSIANFFLIQQMYLRPKVKKAVLLGFTAGLATLFQQSDALVVILVLFIIFLNKCGLNQKIKSAFSFLASFVFLVVLPYLLVAVRVFGFSSLKGFLRWFLGYGRSLFDLGSFGFGNLLKLAYGQLRAIFGGNFIKQMLAGNSGVLNLSLLVAFILGVIFLAGILTFGVVYYKRIFKNYKGVLPVMIAWALVYNTFFFACFEQGNFRFNTRSLIPLSVFFGIVAGYLTNRRPFELKIKRGILLAVFPLLLFSVNFFGTLLPQSKLENNTELDYAEFIADKIDNRTFLVFSGVGLGVPSYLEYFFGWSGKFYLLQSALNDESCFSGKLEEHFKRGDGIYFISDTRSISSAVFIKSLGGKYIRFDVNGRLTQDFLSRYGYRLDKFIEYNGDNEYKGNWIYRLTKK